MTQRTSISRRHLLGGFAGFAGLALANRSLGQERLPAFNVDFRGSIDAGQFGIEPGQIDSGARAFNAMLRQASERNLPVFLPPGTYQLSNIELPSTLRLQGVPGATRLIYGGDGHFLRAIGARKIALEGLTIDGQNRWLAEDQPGLMTLIGCDEVRIDNCEILGAARNALSLEKCAATISDNRIGGAADAAIYAVESRSLTIRDNEIRNCGDGGILVHRWTKAYDGAVISGNRIADIGARSGGTGQYGNGINLFRADNVQVTGNHITDCAFTAVRANAASDIQISGNHCLRSGETAIYSEFGFEGAIISDNLIDGAANGIASVNFNDGGRLSIIKGNLIRNLALTGPYEPDGNYFGIGISAEADTIVADNVVENAPRWGMVFGWGPYLRNVSVTGNMVRKAPVGMAVSVVEGCGTILLRDNLFADVKEAAIAGYRWIDKVTGDLADLDKSGFSHVDLSGNRRS